MKYDNASLYTTEEKTTLYLYNGTVGEFADRIGVQPTKTYTVPEGIECRLLIEMGTASKATKYSRTSQGIDFPHTKIVFSNQDKDKLVNLLESYESEVLRQNNTLR